MWSGRDITPKPASLIRGDRPVRHPDPVAMTLVHHGRDELREEDKRLVLVLHNPRSREIIVGDLVGLACRRLPEVAEKDACHVGQSGARRMVPGRRQERSGFSNVHKSANSTERAGPMRFVLLATAAATMIAALGSIAPAAAQDRYCLQGRRWGYPGNCQFATYGQCMAAASGTDAFCGVNPRHAFARQRHWHRY